MLGGASAQCPVGNVLPATDDWPFLYLQRSGISSFYLILLCLFGLVAILAVFIASKEMRVGLTGRGEFDGEMFRPGIPAVAEQGGNSGKWQPG